MSIIRILFQFVNYVFYVLWPQYEEDGRRREVLGWGHGQLLGILGLRHFTVGRFWKFLLLPKPIGFLPHHLHPTDSRWEQRQVDSEHPSPLVPGEDSWSPHAFLPPPAPSWFQFSSFLFFLSLCWTFVYYGRALVLEIMTVLLLLTSLLPNWEKWKIKTPAFYLAFGKMGWINHFYALWEILDVFSRALSLSLRLFKWREMSTYFRIFFFQFNFFSTSGKQALGMNLECTFSLSWSFLSSPSFFPSSCYSKIMVWNCGLFFLGWLLVSFFSRLVMNCFIHFCTFLGQKTCDFCYFTLHVQSYRCKLG